jgi:transcriptional regulator with XRE-family HTH domain
VPEKNLAYWFGVVIRDMRVERGYSQEEFAYRAGIHRTYMTHVERGTKNPTLGVVAKIAHALDVELSAIWLEVERRGDGVSQFKDPLTPHSPNPPEVG